MNTIHELKTELNFTRSVRSLISSKEEISIMRMQKIRNLVEQTREFTKGLSQITDDIRQAYTEQLHVISEQGTIEQLIKFSISVKKGALVLVLVTPNTRLSGTIVPKVYSVFEAALANQPFADIVIIGVLGKQLFSQSKYANRLYTYFEIPEHSIESKDLQGLISYLAGYAKIDVYYGKLHSLVNQEAVETDITAEKLFETSNNEILNNPGDVSRLKVEDKFFFEPDYRQILQAMEIQFLALFFKQIIDESLLAQLGSRISFMEDASDNIDKAIKQLAYQEKVSQKIKYNKKMQQTYAGLSLWS